MNLEDLKKEISYHWRVQSFSKWKPIATCVAYIDARDAEDLLDEVCKPENWQVDYKMVGDKRFAGVAIKVEKEWVWKWDTGTETKVEAEKGEVSDSFKRACVKWGIGRFLYRFEVKRVKTNEKKTKDNRPYVIDNSNKRIWDLTAHIGGKPKVETIDDVKKKVSNVLDLLKIKKDKKAEYLKEHHKVEFELNTIEGYKKILTELTKNK